MSGMVDVPHDDLLVVIGGLRRLARHHRYIEDCWYSCPKAPEGCCDDTQGDECNCGADENNALIYSLLSLLAPLAGVATTSGLTSPSP